MKRSMQSGAKAGADRIQVQAVSVFLALLACCSIPLIAAPLQPDFGPNVLVFSPTMPAATIQTQIDAVYAVQQHNEFGSQRNAFLFLPGEYKVNIPIGFYTEVVGLGGKPD